MSTKRWLRLEQRVGEPLGLTYGMKIQLGSVPL